eukprot:1157160-Pelagomonas_calceolata.AAC.7
MAGHAGSLRIRVMAAWQQHALQRFTSRPCCTGHCKGVGCMPRGSQGGRLVPTWRQHHHRVRVRCLSWCRCLYTGLDLLISYLRPFIIHVNRTVPARYRREVKGIFAKKKLEKGVAFPTCVSVNQ